MWRSQSNSSISPGPDLEWTLVGSGRDRLLGELDKLYWDGIAAELENILCTLRAWKQPEFASVVVDDDSDGSGDYVHGFDTFINQVSGEARSFAAQYRERGMDESEPEGDTGAAYKIALEGALKDRRAEYVSAKIKSSVRQAIDNVPRLTGMRKRAWTLLQAAGFLDIEKLIEHRPPPSAAGPGRPPAIPQLSLSKIDKSGVPSFEPLHCSHPKCNEIISGAMFVSQRNDEPVICEDCYRLHHYGSESYAKKYQHCVLTEAVTPEISRRICDCKDVPHFDQSGKPLDLFPMDRAAKHSVGNLVSKGCSLYALGDTIAMAKYAGLHAVSGVKLPSKSPKILSKFMSAMGRDGQTTGKNRFTHRGHGVSGVAVNSRKPNGVQGVTTDATLSGSKRQPAVSPPGAVVFKAQDDKDIPEFFRNFADKNPFANIHMALRVGPLVIENGVAHTKNGVLITTRETPVFHQRFDLHFLPNRCFAVSGNADRTVWTQIRQPATHKRYKMVMKQVIGAPFSGLLPHEDELQIIEDLLAASRQPLDDTKLHDYDQLSSLGSALQPVLSKLRRLMESRVEIYLLSIANRLLDPTLNLAWTPLGNDCRTFCNALIDRRLFEALVNGPSTAPGKDVKRSGFRIPSPLYVMSFVCPDDEYPGVRALTKFDVPSGLTEEYLLRFHFSRYGDADIIDSLQEYWYGWGAFGAPLYPHQDLFPWDCTEAYDRYPTRCGDCNLAKHVWAFPFDSWSIISLHLLRDRYLYAPMPPHAASTIAPIETPEPVVMTACNDPKAPEGDTRVAGESAALGAFVRNRLSILSAALALNRAAVAMACTPRFCKATAWLHSPPPLSSSTTTTPRRPRGERGPSLARVKLGGIHRAQPFSHYFDSGTYGHYFVASWTLLHRRDQVAAYESLRDKRASLPDVPPADGRAPRFADTRRDSDGRAFFGFAGFNTRFPTTTDSALITHIGMRDIPIADAGLSQGSTAPKPDTDAGPACAVNCGSNCGTACGGAGGRCGGSNLSPACASCAMCGGKGG